MPLHAFSVAKIATAIEPQITAICERLVASHREGRRSLLDLIGDPEAAAFVARHMEMPPAAPLDMTDLRYLERVADGLLRYKGWPMPAWLIRTAAARAIERENQSLRGHEVAE
jgi:hypothetical protein